MNPKLADHFVTFMDGVYDRLKAGAAEYGDTSFDMTSAELIKNIREELWDVAGWAIILDMRLKRLADAIARAEHGTP